MLWLAPKELETIPLKIIQKFAAEIESETWLHFIDVLTRVVIEMFNRIQSLGLSILVKLSSIFDIFPWMYTCCGTLVKNPNWNKVELSLDNVLSKATLKKLKEN